MKKSLLITAALLMGSVSFTYANAGNFKAMTFAEMDKNGDSQLAKDEVQGRLLARFDQLDTDNSGTLSADELSGLRKGRGGKNDKRATFAEMDKNSDGQLAKDEVWGRLSANFDQLDTDKSGTLSSNELSALRKGRGGKHHKRPTFAELDTDGSGTLSESEFAAQGKGRAGKNFKRPTFTEMDKNSDGVLAKEEVGGPLFADFELLDTDNSGTLSIDELSVLRKGRPGKNFKRPTFAEMDKNSDGVLAKEEVGGRLSADFERLDTDSSGTLSADELSQARGQRQGLLQQDAK